MVDFGLNISLVKSKTYKPKKNFLKLLSKTKLTNLKNKNFILDTQKM